MTLSAPDVDVHAWISTASSTDWAPEDEAGDLSETLERVDGHHHAALQPVLQVLGNGESLQSLRTPGLVSIGNTIEIGRRPGGGPDRDTLVLADRTVSAHHARIQFAHAAVNPYIIEDLASRNGTFVDGRRVDGFTPLRDGALLFLGSQALVFRLMTAEQLAAVRRDAEQPFGPLPTLSPTLACIAAKLRLLAASSTEIFLIGETGVGKEVFARAIHAASGMPGQFVAVNCAAIPASLVESELFGYERGAHSTASIRKAGMVDLATHGTLFLDEIGDMSIDLQAKLLRFVQDRQFTPLGSTRIIKSDARIIAATSRTVAGPGGQVHEALLGRLGAQPVELPRLRDRVEEIGRLAAHFLEQKTGSEDLPAGGAAGPLFEAEAFQALLLHTWPLNVRELSKAVGEMAILCRGRPIDLQDLPAAVRKGLRIVPRRDDLQRAAATASAPSRGTESSAGKAPTELAADTAPGMSPEIDRQRIVTTLAACAGNQSRAAKLLGMSRQGFLRRLDRYGIPRPQKGAP